MIDQLAQKILDVYQTGQSCDPLHQSWPEMTLKDAYLIQKKNTEHWLKSGRRLVGRKIGLTSKSVQIQLGVDQPDYGMLYADMAYCSGDTIDFSSLFFPKAEVEIAFVLSKDLPHEHNTVNEVMNAIEYVLPAIEIADSRITDWKIKIVDTIADNASSGLYILGSVPKKLKSIDLEMCGMVLDRKGNPVSTGAGLACLGNPLIAAAWLANKMVENNSPLKAGDIILSGALGPMVNLNAGDSITARINGIGEVTAHFSN